MTPPSVRIEKRSTDRLLTLDRAFLVGIFSIGIWVATNTLIRDDLVKQVTANRLELDDQGRDMAQLKIENAILKTKLEQISVDIARIASVVERVARP